MKLSKVKVGSFLFILGIFFIPVSFLSKRFFHLTENEYLSFLIFGVIVELIGFILLQKKSVN